MEFLFSSLIYDQRIYPLWIYHFFCACVISVVGVVSNDNMWVVVVCTFFVVAHIFQKYPAKTNNFEFVVVLAHVHANLCYCRICFMYIPLLSFY